MEAVKHIAQWEELMQTIDGLDNLFVLHRLGVGVVDVLLWPAHPRTDSSTDSWSSIGTRAPEALPSVHEDAGLPLAA